MKNKLKKTMTALCAALILMGGFSVPAYAQGAATEPPAGDATNDSGVIVEEKEETPPLTPKGNATLVDDYGGNKQLITVTTKGGNYFYTPVRAFRTGVFCCSKNFLKKFQKIFGVFQKRRIAPRKGGSTTNFPTRKEVRMWNLIAGSFTNNVLFRSFVIRCCTMKRVTLTGSCTGIRQGKSPFPICP